MGLDLEGKVVLDIQHQAVAVVVVDHQHSLFKMVEPILFHLDLKALVGMVGMVGAEEKTFR